MKNVSFEQASIYITVSPVLRTISFLIGLTILIIITVIVRLNTLRVMCIMLYMLNTMDHLLPSPQACFYAGPKINK